MVLLKLSKMPLINCAINLILTWSVCCVLLSDAVANQAATFAITDGKIYVPIVTLSTQDNAKLFNNLKEELTGKSSNQQ